MGERSKEVASIDNDDESDIDLDMEDEAYNLLHLSQGRRIGGKTKYSHFDDEDIGPIEKSCMQRWPLMMLPAALLLILLLSVLGAYIGGGALHYFHFIDAGLNDFAKQQAYTRLTYLQESMGKHHLKNEVVIKNLGEDYGLGAYSARLNEIFQEYFAPRGRYAKGRGPYASMWERIEEHLTIGVKSTNESRIPHRISSSIRNTSSVPEAFEKWKTYNADWTINLYNDTDMEEYLQAQFASMGRPNVSVESEDSTQLSFIDRWHRLPYNILRVDTFRYLNIFLQGGVYSDSDTGGLYSIEQWPGMTKPHTKVFDKTDNTLRFLEALPTLYHQKQSNSSPLQAFWKVDHVKDNVTTQSPTHWTPPGLAVAIEYDAPGGRKQWKEKKLARPLQITQVSSCLYYALLPDC